MARTFSAIKAASLLSFFYLILVSCSDSPEPYVRKTKVSQGANAESGDIADQDSDPLMTGNNQTPGTSEPGVSTMVPTNPTPAPTAPSGGAASGTTTVSFTPVRYPNAVYGAFVYAVWVTDSGGRYIKTLGARAATRLRFLDKWTGSAGVAQPDGLTGATLPYPAAPTPISLSWDMKDKAGAFVPQGNYNINIQMTSSNNTGVNLLVPVTINAAASTKNDASMATGITAVEAKHTP